MQGPQRFPAGGQSFAAEQPGALRSSETDAALYHWVDGQCGRSTKWTERSQLRHELLVAVSAALLGLMTLLFVNWYDVI